MNRLLLSWKRENYELVLGSNGKYMGYDQPEKGQMTENERLLARLKGIPVNDRNAESSNVAKRGRDQAATGLTSW